MYLSLIECLYCPIECTACEGDGFDFTYCTSCIKEYGLSNGLCQKCG